jgi:hypothetical protein
MPFDLNNLLFRGDSREPGMIFPFGFTRRMNSWEYFENKWKEYLDDKFGEKLESSFRANKFSKTNQSGVAKMKDEDEDAYVFRAALGFTPLKDSDADRPNFRYTDNDRSHTLTFQDSARQTHKVTLQLDKSPADLWAQWLKESRLIKMRAQGDLDLASGVCETPDITVASLFPIPAVYPTNGRDETWIYVIYNDKSNGLFKTFKKQSELAKKTSSQETSKVLASLARSKEVASYDVPSGYVLAAVKCKRHWTLSVQRGFIRSGNERLPKFKVDWRQGVSFTLQGPVLFNPKLANQTDLMKRLKERMDAVLSASLDQQLQCMEFKELPDAAVFA